MKKVFKVADIHELLKQVHQGNISYSRMVEIMNEKADEFAKETLIEYEDFATQNPMLGGSVNEFLESNYKPIQIKDEFKGKPEIKSIQIGDDIIDLSSHEDGSASIKVEEIRPNAADFDEMFGIEDFKSPETFFPVVLQTEKYKKLFAVQSHPETKYFFKDKEVSLEELTGILERM